MKRLLPILGLWSLPLVASARSISEWFECNVNAFVGCSFVNQGEAAITALMSSIEFRIVALIWGIGVIVIFYAAIRIISSRGNSEAIDQGKKAVQWAVIGIILMTLAAAIVNFIRQLIYTIGG